MRSTENADAELKIRPLVSTYLERTSIPQSRGMMDIGIVPEPRSPTELDHVLKRDVFSPTHGAPVIISQSLLAVAWVVYADCHFTRRTQPKVLLAHEELHPNRQHETQMP